VEVPIVEAHLPRRREQRSVSASSVRGPRGAYPIVEAGPGVSAIIGAVPSVMDSLPDPVPLHLGPSPSLGRRASRGKVKLLGYQRVIKTPAAPEGAAGILNVSDISLRGFAAPADQAQAEDAGTDEQQGSWLGYSCRLKRHAIHRATINYS
jgi:hypothetical protein